MWKVSSALGVMLRRRQQPREGWHGGAGRLENKQAGDKDSVCTHMETTGPGREGTTIWLGGRWTPGSNMGPVSSPRAAALWGCGRWWGGEACCGEQQVG